MIQGPGHASLAFAGPFESDHPVLQTCTANNNVCPPTDGRMRFALSYEQVRAPGRSRESVMDANPWTYQVMAAEMVREGRVEPVPNPATPDLADQRTYLYVEVSKQTTTPANGAGPWVGLVLGVHLRNDATLYLSNHGLADWAIPIDGAAATTIELPVGATAADVTEIVGVRVPVGTADTGATVTVTDLNRAFFLGTDYLPQPSFVVWHGSAVLTPAQPAATLWSAVSQGSSGT